MTINPEKGTRWSTAAAFLKPAMKRPNLTVISKTLTDKIIMEGTTAKEYVNINIVW